MSSAREGLCDAAIHYASLGWRVLPVHSASSDGCSCGDPNCKSVGKHPRLSKWQRRASTDPETISSWWTAWPDGNIGIATGQRSGIIAIDVDVGNGKDGPTSLAKLQSEFGPLPETICVNTGGGGRHLIFEWPGQPMKTRAGIAPGIDVRADGGYIVAPPSSHASRREYAFAAGRSPDDIEAAALPSWLSKLIQGNNSTNGSRAPDPRILEGERNCRLTALAGAVRGQGFRTDIIQSVIEAVNTNCCDPPLDLAEVKRIADSIGRYPASRTTFRGGTFWEREVLDKLFSRPQELRLFQFLVSEAAWRDHEGVFSAPLEGQLHTTYRAIADRCAWVENNELKKWSTSTVRRLLRTLVSDGRITAESTEHGTLVMIVNYPQFKGFSAHGS